MGVTKALRKLTALVCAATLTLTGCGSPYTEAAKTQSPSQTTAASPVKELNDPELLQQAKDAVAAQLEETLGSDDFVVERVSTVFVSKEYLEELKYNSQATTYFGYSLAEIEDSLGSERYVFTSNENGETVVKPFENYDDTYDRVFTNVCIGSGVIIICATVTILTGGAAAPATVPTTATTINTIFTAATVGAASGAGISTLTSGISTAISEAAKGSNFEDACKSISLNASEGFKVGAIIGAATGAITGALEALAAKGTIPTWQESEEFVASQNPDAQTQVSYLNKEPVAPGTPGAVRPDLVTTAEKPPVAIEVKNYNLTDNFNQLKHVLKRQLEQRANELPDDFKQKVVLDVRNRGYSPEQIKSWIDNLTQMAKEIDPTIVIEAIT